MYRIKVGNMYLTNFCLDDNIDAALNEFIDHISLDSSEAKLFKYEMAANKIADKIYIVLGVKATVEKVGEKDE